MLSTVGWHTITGLELMLQALLMGDRLVVMARSHPREASELVQQEQVTILAAVPTAFQVMLGVEGFEQYDTSSLLICGTGSAPCPPHLAQEIQRRFHCALHIGFGATETAGGIAATSLADSDQHQVVDDASFVEDLMADSIKLVEMMLRMEEMGIDIPLESAWEVQTVGDAYRVYSEHASSQA